jgi:hypothetical protein
MKSMTKWPKVHAVAMQRNAPRDTGIIEGNIQRNGNHPTKHTNWKYSKEKKRDPSEV